MNPRIYELALQAGFQYIKDEGIGWAGNYNASLPKFAELIVQDCVNVLQDNGMWNSRVSDVLDEHFGVE